MNDASATAATPVLAPPSRAERVRPSSATRSVMRNAVRPSKDRSSTVSAPADPNSCASIAAGTAGRSGTAVVRSMRAATPVRVAIAVAVTARCPKPIGVPSRLRAVIETVARVTSPGPTAKTRPDGPGRALPRSATTAISAPPATACAAAIAAAAASGLFTAASAAAAAASAARRRVADNRNQSAVMKKDRRMSRRPPATRPMTTGVVNARKVEKMDRNSKLTQTNEEVAQLLPELSSDRLIPEGN